MAIYLIGSDVWIDKVIPESEGILWLAVLLLPYFGGLFLFTYGYELYDWKKAIGLTLIAGLIGLALVLVIIAIVFALKCLAEGAGSGSSSSSSSSKSSRSSGGSSRSSAGSWSLRDAFGSGSSRHAGSSGDLFRDSGSTQAPATCPTCGQLLPAGIGSPCPYCAALQARAAGGGQTAG